MYYNFKSARINMFVKSQYTKSMSIVNCQLLIYFWFVSYQLLSNDYELS